MRLEHGTIILQSAIDQNITFWARGRGAVNMHTETGVYSLSHQMVGANSDIMNRLDSMEQHMRTSLTLSEQLDSLRGQVQEIVSLFSTYLETKILHKKNPHQELETMVVWTLIQLPSQ